MNLFELLERFVVAHEKQADAAMLMAKAQYSTGGSLPPQQLGDLQEAGKPDGTECTAGRHVSGSDATTASTEEAQTLPDWDPLVDPIQGRYGKDKLQILDRCLASAGISLKASATGAEKHQVLLDAAKDADAEAVDMLSKPVEEPATPAAQPATIDSVRALAQEAVKGGMTPIQVQAIFEEIGGSRRLPEIEEQHMPAIHAKLTAAVKKG